MKVSEVIYMVLDLAKAATSNSSYFTEEHVLFLCKKYRAFLIKKEQEKNKGIEDAFSIFEQQEICLDLEKVPAIDGEPCTGGYYLRSTKPIPKLLEGYQPKVYPTDYFQGLNISFVSADRMRYVGSNPYLQNILYTSIAPDKYLYLNSSNPQFLYLKKLRMLAVFEDFENAKDLLCDDSGEATPCDILDMDFPIREHLVPPMIELVVKELTGAVYKPQDDRNNASDDLSKVRSQN
jgi:hypothetical protein